MMKRVLIFAAASSLACTAAWANYNCQGIVVDETGEPLIGVVVTPEGSAQGVTTDIDGRFNISVPDRTSNLELRFVGYKPKTVKATPTMGTIAMDIESNLLSDVIVTQSVARSRVTPTALSNVDAATIDLKLGNQEFPEILKTTPGVWATKDGGGFGDAKINMRGFKSPYMAVLINGIPVNDMEWGGIYWSNWAGLADVTSTMQTQRGLGASVLSAPSVGGTINIVTKSLDAKQGGSVWYGMGNDGLNQFGATVSTGLMKNGWAVTLLGSRRWGDGYVQGTNFDSYNYFINVSKRLNDAHQLSLTAFGAPQWHDQRQSANGLTIEGWQNVRDYMDGESPYRYNPTYGFDAQGQRRTSNHNHYHKPQISLNHIWQINERSSLSTAVYVSLANGGGYSGQGRGSWNGNTISYTSWYGASNGVLSTLFRNPDGTFAYDKIQQMNSESTTGSNMVMSDSNNSHNWYGLVSTYKGEVIKNRLNLTAGIDLRYYKGKHNNKIVDLYSGAYYMDDSSRDDVKPENNKAALDPNWIYQKLGVGDIVYRDYDGYTVQEGIFAQGEFFALNRRLTAVLTGSLNNTTYWRVDRFYYDKEHEKSDTRSFLGGTAKLGINYNIDRHNNVYVNGGYISRAPYFSQGVFLSSTVSNTINPNPMNEKMASFELGYAYHSPIFSATVDAYYTKWMDKTTNRSGDITSGDHAGQRYYLNLSGVGARHMGVEVAATFQPATWVTVEGMVSIGDWVWDSNSKGYFYNNEGQPLANLRGDVASGILAEDHAWAILNQKGVKVGGSAQWTGALSATFRPFKGWTVGADWTLSSHNYSDYQVSSSSYNANKEVNVADPWRIPWGQQIDLHASYRFKMGGCNAVLSGNINNLCDYNYVMDAYTQSSDRGEWDNAYRVFYSFGRTYSLKLKLNF